MMMNHDHNNNHKSNKIHLLVHFTYIFFKSVQRLKDMAARTVLVGSDIYFYSSMTRSNCLILKVFVPPNPLTSVPTSTRRMEMDHDIA